MKKFVESFPVLLAVEGGAPLLRQFVLDLAKGGRLPNGGGTKKGGPEGWPVAPVSETFTALSTQGKKVLTSDVTDEGKHPVVDQGQILVRGYVDDDTCVIAPPRPVVVFGDHTRVVKFIDFPFVPGADGTKILLPRADIDPRFFFWMLKSIQLEARGYGRHFGRLLEHSIPVPSLPEQKRIVAKVDQLMRLIDELEAKQTKKREVQTRFRTSALDALTKAEGAEEAALTCKRVSGNFGVLFERADTVPELRQVIRRVAIQGRLDGGGRQSVPTEDPWPTPAHWRWTNAETLCEFITKGTTPTATEMFSGEGPVPFLKVYNLTFGGPVDFTIKPTFISTATHMKDLARSRVIAGDVLMNIVGPPLGKVSIVPSNYPEWNINQAIARFRPKTEILASFLSLCLLEVTGLMSHGEEDVKGTAGQDNISLAQCRALPLPVPPLAEQRRIVAKVEALMKLCDDLEAKLKAKETTAGKLVEAVVKEMVA